MYTQRISRNELARPIMDTIFLVYICVCLRLSMGNPYKNLYAKMCGWNYLVQIRLCSKSVLGV